LKVYVVFGHTRWLKQKTSY